MAFLVLIGTKRLLKSQNKHLMYELAYVKQRKKRRRNAIIGGIGAIGVATFCIVAFLGRYTGTFTVSLEAKNVELTLSEKSSFENRSSFLRVNEVPSFQEFTYENFKKYGGDEKLDNEETGVFYGANPNNESLNFFKYTFFVKNVGIIPAKYNLSLQMKESVAASDGRTLDDTIRVAVYNNGEETVYAKGNLNTPAPISVSEGEATEEYPFRGYATNFVSSKEIMRQEGVEMNVGEVRRYTIVTWLEGFRSSNTQLAPKGATIKLGVEINAYENE